MVANRFSSIQYPEELRKLSKEDLGSFAAHLRKKIILALAKREGHLGSSLGTVELTVALHYSFNTPDDILIWDVGHQAYGHKMITGREKAFQRLRQYNGISGFPKLSESLYDNFGTGHAGTAISAALGMALANDLKGVQKQHIAIVGDASIANGMAFEALNHLGNTKANVLVILNDNTMGIDPSVGALKNYFENIKKETPSTPNFFQSLNLQYTGPVDGHNMEEILDELRKQKKIIGPRILHIVTKKGKGLSLAEDQQIAYHSPGKFNPLTGIINNKQNENKIKYQNIFGETLLKLAKTNEKIIVITPAMPTGSGLVKIMETFPSRCIDVGIAEQHAVTLAAGMATQGLMPFCVIYSTFLQRAYDQIIHDVALQNLPIVFCVDRAGLVGNDGPTHHGVFDIAFLRCIPNLHIAAPKDANTLQNILFTAQQGLKHPLAIRYPRGYSEETTLNLNFKKIPWGKGRLIKKGSSIAVLSIGTLASTITKSLCQIKKSEAFSHYDLCFIKPLDTEMLNEICSTYKALIVFEEGVKKGGAGTAILEYANEKGYKIPIQLEGISDNFISHGNPEVLLREVGLDNKSITEKLSLLLNKTEGRL